MGVTNVKAGSVSERHFLPPLKRVSGTNTVVTQLSDIDIDDKAFEAGENLTAGYVANVYTDGKAYLASPLYSDNKPAYYFIVNTVSTGEQVFLRKFKLIPAIISGTAGDLVYIRDATPNISTTPLTTKAAGEDLQQIVGFFTETDNFIQPLFMKAGQLL